MSVPEPPAKLILACAGLLGLLLGVALGTLYAEARRVAEFAQLATIAHTVTHIGEECVASLDDITKAALVLVRTTPAPPPAVPRRVGAP